ncbi:MAG TPA: hypothetical protein VI320_17395 [Terracidiphilus sp.]
MVYPRDNEFRNVFFGPENRNGIRAGQYNNDIGAPLFGRFVQLFFDVAKDEGLPGRDDIVVAHTWWYAIFGLATLMVIKGVVPDLPDQTLVVEQTIATLWAGVQAVPRLPKSAITKRSGRSSASKREQLLST